MNVLAISDGVRSSGTINLKGIKKVSKHKILIKQFYASSSEIDWATMEESENGLNFSKFLKLDKIKLG